jgi:hypothetical protein
MATVTIQKYTGSTKTSYAVKFKDPLTRKKKHYKSYGRKKDAQQSANEIRALIDSDKAAEISKARFKREILKFEDAAERLMDDWAERFERNELSEATFDGYTCLANVLKRTFAGRLIGQISKDELLIFQKRMLKESTAVRANRYFFVLKQIFKYPQSIGVISEDPANDIRYLSEKAHE